MKLRQMELQSAEVRATRIASPGAHTHPPPRDYDVRRHVALPPFRETEVDAYFTTFERLAAALQWPKDIWTTLLQCKFTGKAQDVIASLSLEDGLDYDLVKIAVLRAYELVPEAYRQKFRILKHFFWPKLKTSVAQYCQTCHSCQVTGKPNQVIPPAPLCPIPVMNEPFSHVIVDCVGPLPKSKTGNQFVLTIMCAATRFPEAIPLRTITSKSVIRALTKFFSTFGFPKSLQTDQGTNFLSRIFKQVLQSLSITHKVSSAYHPESQGALERWHQTFKSVLRKYCLDTGKCWDEGVPFALFALRETVQESLGFSPAELVFGHTVRGPLKVLK